MKKLILYFFIFCIINIPCVYAQDDVNENKPIEFKFGDNAFNKNLPFDQFFSIKLKDVPNSLTSVGIIIYEFSPNVIGKKTKRADTEVIIPQAIREYVFGPKKRFVSSDKDIEIAIPLRLKPNSDYILVVNGHVETPLSSAEKTFLETTLKAGPSCKKLFDRLIKTYFKDKTGSNLLLNEIQADFNYQIQAEIKKIDSKYHLNAVNNIDQLIQLSTLTNSLREIKTKIGDINGSLGAVNNVKKSDVAKNFQNIEKEFMLINWGTIAKDAADRSYSGITKMIDESLSVLDAPASPTLVASRDEIKNQIDILLDSRQDIIDQFLQQTIIPNVVSLETVGTTYRADFVKNAKFYITLDAGLSYNFKIDRLLAYSGANIYFRPVNKNVPLSQYKKFGDHLGVRTSLLLGITMGSFERENVRKGIVGSSAFVLGAGYRVAPFLKVNGGTMIYYSIEPNPILSRERMTTTFSPFVSLSLDLDVKNLFGGVSSAMFKEN